MATFNIATHGIKPEVSAANLVHAVGEYEKWVAGLKGETSKAEVPTLESAEDQAQADSLVSTIRENLFSSLESTPILSTVLVEALQAITKDVREFRTWYVDSARRSGKTVTVDASDVSKYGKMFQEVISSLYTNAVMFGEELPEDFKVKTSKTTGKVVPVLSRLPYTKSGNTSGGKVGGYTLRFRWHPNSTVDLSEDWYGQVTNTETGELIEADEWVEVPAGTFTDEIAMKYVSTPTYRVERAEVFDALATKEVVTPSGRVKRRFDMPTDGSSVFVQFESGVLEAWLPTDAPVEDDDDDDDDDESNEEDSTEE